MRIFVAIWSTTSVIFRLVKNPVSKQNEQGDLTPGKEQSLSATRGDGLADRERQLGVQKVCPAARSPRKPCRVFPINTCLKLNTRLAILEWSEEEHA